MLDQLVELIARAMDALGLNGTRLRWRWNRRRESFSETKAQAANRLRTAQGKHKMCPSCRALVPRGARRCEECGTSLAGVSAPGAGRLLSQMFPGMSRATSVIMLANGFLFVLALVSQIKLSQSQGAGFGLFSGFSGEVLVPMGSGLSRYYPPLETGGEWWRLITPIFLHGGLIHFAMNSYMLLNLGPMLEEAYGKYRFWVIYLAAGIAGNVVSQTLRPVNTVGASGAIFGLIGLLFVFAWKRGGQELVKRWAIQIVIFTVVLTLGTGFGIDHFAHGGGLLCGVAFGFGANAGVYRTAGRQRVWEGFAIAGILLVLASFGFAAMQARG